MSNGSYQIHRYIRRTVCKPSSKAFCRDRHTGPKKRLSFLSLLVHLMDLQFHSSLGQSFQFPPLLCHFISFRLNKLSAIIHFCFYFCFCFYGRLSTFFCARLSLFVCVSYSFSFPFSLRLRLSFHPRRLHLLESFRSSFQTKPWKQTMSVNCNRYLDGGPID